MKEIMVSVVLGVLIGIATYDLYVGLKNATNMIIEILIKVVAA